MNISEYIKNNQKIDIDEFMFQFEDQKIFFPLGPNNLSFANMAYNSPDVLSRISYRPTDIGDVAVFMASKSDVRLTRPFVAIPLFFAAKNVILKNRYVGMLIYGHAGKSIVFTKESLISSLPILEKKISEKNKILGINEYIIDNAGLKQNEDFDFLCKFKNQMIHCSLKKFTIDGVEKDGFSTYEDKNGNKFIFFYTDENDGRLLDRVLHISVIGALKMTLEIDNFQGMMIHSDQDAWYIIPNEVARSVLKTCKE